MRIILVLARKDLRILMRVRSGLFFTFVWPVVVAILFGVVFSAPAQNAATALRVVGCVMSFAIGLVSERVHGTFVRLQTAPITRFDILADKALACFAAISTLQIALVTIGVVGFGIRPSYPMLALSCLSASAGFVGPMMMVAGLGRTEQSASGAGWAMLMPMTLFGGGMMPQFIMPAWMQTVGHASPVKWAILAMEGAVWRRFSLTEMLLPCGILLAFGTVCFAIGVRGLRDT